MNKKTILISIIAISVAFLLFASCEVEDIEVGTPQELKIDELNTKNIKLIIMLPINNPNNFGFRIRNVDIDIFLSGQKIGKINKIDRVNIPKNSNDIYPIVFEIETSGILVNMMTIIRELQLGRPNIGLKGNIKAGRLFITNNIKVEHEQIFELY